MFTLISSLTAWLQRNGHCPRTTDLVSGKQWESGIGAHESRIGSNFGFTLIELLVVISVIGLLSSTVLASLNSARSSAKATQVVSSLNQIQQAIEAYKTNTGSYPDAGGSFDTYDGTGSGSIFHELVNKGYLQSFPPVRDFTSYDEFYIYDRKSGFPSYFMCDGQYDDSSETYVIGFASDMDPGLLPDDVRRFDGSSGYGPGSPCITNH